VSRRRMRGYSLLEVTVAMTVFGVFLVIFFLLTADMRQWEKRLPVNYMRNPQIMAVIARIRRDVLDAHGNNPYRNSHDGYTMSGKTLILESLLPNGGVQIIVWDFATEGVVKRVSYNVGFKSQWVTRDLPREFSSNVDIDAVEMPGRPFGVRLTARDRNGKVSIDQILQPRAHQ